VRPFRVPHGVSWSNVTEDLRRIRRFITALTWRERLLLLARVGLYTLLVGVVVEVVAVAAATGRWNRPAAMVALVLVAGIGTWLAVLVPLALRWRPTGDPMRQARLVEALTPVLRGRLLTSVERTDGPMGQESPALLALVARRAAGAVAAVQPHRVHPSGSILRLAAITAIAAMAGLLVALVAPGGPGNALRWWFAGGSAQAAVDGIRFDPEEEHARVGDLVLQYTYPEYTGLDPVEVSNSTGDAHGPPGTTVRVIAKSATPVEAAALVAYDEPALDAQVTDGRSLSGSFTIRADSGFYHLVTYQRGEPRDSRPFSITPEPDLVPDVNLDVESEVLEVAVDEPIRIGWRARDDYGVARVVLEFDGREQTPALLVPRERKVEVWGALGSRPFQLGLRPGDRVRLRVVAWDNDTYSGSKPGASRAIEVVVLGARGLDERADERQEALRDLMLDVLADHLEEPWPVSDTVGGLVSWGAELARRYDPLDEAIEEYWSGVIPETLEGDAVRRVTRTGRELIRYTQVAFTPGSSERPASEEVAIVSDLRDKAIVAVEDGILALDRSIEMRALRELSEDARELSVAAENLREMMEGEPDAQEMLARLDRLERQLAQMMQSAARLHEGGLQEFVNQREGELQSLIDEIREAIAEGRLDEARELMEQLTRQIRQLGEGIQDNLEQMMSDESDAMAQAQDFLEQLKELEEKQLALQEEVRGLRQEGDAGASQRAEELWSEIERRAERLAERGQEYGEGLEKAGRAFHEQEVAGSASDQLEHLRESASARDLNGVRQTIPMAELDWRRAESRHQLEEARAGGKLSGPGEREIWQIQRELRELEELVASLEQTSSGLDPQTREQVREQRQQQQQLEGELREARRQARELERGFPVRPEGLQQGLRDAGEQMEQASEDLGRGQPMQAEGAQEMAAQRVRDAREALERAMEQARQQAMQLSQSSRPEDGGRPKDDGSEGMENRAEVEIPSPEEFRTPEEYRRALLEGMQGDVPEEYRAAKKRYYEELVHQ